jgi:predicted solute-binding protein
MSYGRTDSGSAIVSSKNIEKETKKYKTLKTKKHGLHSTNFVIFKLVYGKFHLLKINKMVYKHMHLQSKSKEL